MTALVITGRVTGHYKTGDGEIVWLIAWDDRQHRPLTDVDCDEVFRDGQQVRIANGRLESVR